jgi:hypothetical protein
VLEISLQQQQQQSLMKYGLSSKRYHPTDVLEVSLRRSAVRISSSQRYVVIDHRPHGMVAAAAAIQAAAA